MHGIYNTLLVITEVRVLFHVSFSVPFIFDDLVCIYPAATLTLA